MKKIIILLITLFSLTGCKSYQNTISKFDVETFNKDIAKLEDPEFSTLSNADYQINNYLYYQGEKIIYTVQIVYKDLELNNFKAILVPIQEQVNDTLPSIGYNENLSLSSTNDKENKKYQGYNISYSTNQENLKFYLFVSYQNDTYKDDVYYISTFKEVGK